MDSHQIAEDVLGRGLAAAQHPPSQSSYTAHLQVLSCTIALCGELGVLHIVRLPMDWSTAPYQSSSPGPMTRAAMGLHTITQQSRKPSQAQSCSWKGYGWRIYNLQGALLEFERLCACLLGSLP